MEKKNWFLTYRRALIYKGYRFAYKVYGKLCKEYNKLLNREYIDKCAEVKKILVYPVFKGRERLADVLNRIQCAVPEDDNKELKIDIIVNADLVGLDINELETPKFQGRYLKSSSRINFISVKGKIDYKGYDKILIHSYKSLFNLNILFNLTKTLVVDEKFHCILESYSYSTFYYNTISSHKRDEAYQISRSKFALLEQKFKDNKKAYCFCTGPSFSRYKEFEYEPDAVKIICNSVVENKEFLDYIGDPDILTFGDPAFHFGTNDYASKFRDSVVKVAKIYPNMYIVVPYLKIFSFLGNFPELKGRVIGINSGSSLTIPSSNDLKVKGSCNNILTLFMLPIAYALAQEIYIIGADGRHKSEDYFWKHNPSVQLTEQMQSVFKTHPSFFRDRNYKKYYNKHCKTLEELIQFGEENGKSVFSLTPSLIPALKKRHFSSITKH